MQYDLSTKLDRERFSVKCRTLLDKGAVVELTEKSFRTTRQNSYLHLLIGVVAMETGNTLDYAKEMYFKRLCNPDIFVLETEDRYAGKVETLRSSADITKEEMSMAIDRFRRWGAENGIYMPSPEDSERLRDIQIEMGRQRQYLW